MQSTPTPSGPATGISASTGKLQVRDPATGELLRELEITPIDLLPVMYVRAREAQSHWSRLSLHARARKLLDLRETVLNHADELIDLISRENGKPRMEALSCDISPSLELLTYFARNAPRMLRKKRVNIANPILLLRKSVLEFAPLGVVAVISPWNFPMLLPFGEIAMALVAGNAIIFKPSEYTPLIGLKLQELCEEAGFPPGILQTVVGDGRLGAAMIEQRPNKIFFTGSVPTGKKIMEAASKHLIPVCLELGGKDAMIVLQDADLDYATSAALWGAFVNSGQVCASTERLLLHESIAPAFLEKLTAKLGALRQGPSTGLENDLGPVTMEKQKDVYQRQVDQAKKAGAQFLSGGDFSQDRRYLRPAIVTGKDIEKLEIYREETFGPVVAATTFRTIPEAIAKANDSPYGLLASVITKDLSLGEDIARQLDVGTVTINEAVYTAGIPETPWGGVKESGFGRKHSEMGLMEFVAVKHIHQPRTAGLTFKSLWWFPYTPFQYQTFRLFIDLYRKSWWNKLRALPLFLWNFAQFVKRERRL
ncbi:MAG: aldehyde dehydrogenase family protein [Bdellovibrionales bacterium]|nr:aldehyde dehydrogenase family protein [Bdellovibrionales bacterium]